MLSLFNRRATAQQSNLNIDWLLVATYLGKNKNFIQFFVNFNACFLCSAFPGVAKADVE